MLESLPAGKSSVSVLMEYCGKNGFEVVYDPVTNETDQQQVFCFKVTVKDLENKKHFVVTGKGASKKKAKSEASVKMLIEMGELNSSYVDADESLPIDAEGNEISNPVGRVQEYAQKNSLRPVEFEFEEESGPTNQRQFRCIAKLQDTTVQATAANKRIAKRDACAKLLLQIEGFKLGDDTEPEEQEDASFPLSFDISQDVTEPLEQRTTVHILDFETFITKKSKQALQELRDMEKLEINVSESISFLRRIAQQQKWSVSFSEVPSKEKNRFVSLCNLSCQPVAVGSGIADTQEDAKSISALSILHYLHTAAGNYLSTEPES